MQDHGETTQGQNHDFFVFVPLIAVIFVTICTHLEQSPIMNSITFSSDDANHPVRGWMDGDGIWHVFFPSGAGSTVVAHLPKSFEIYLDGIYVSQGFPANFDEKQVIALKSGMQKSAEYTIVFHRSENNPAIHIQTKSGSLDYIHKSKDNDEEGTISIVDANGSIEYQGDLISLSGRGQSTWSGEKKPYNFELAQDFDFFGMGAAQRWVLLANFYDESLIRNKIVYDFAQNLEFAYTPQSVFCDLYVNGDYQGLYLLTEKLEVGPNRLDVPDLQQETQALNPGSLGKYPLFERQVGDGIFVGKKIDKNPADITGGYLMEITTANRVFDDAYVTTGHGNYFIFASPKDPSLEQAEYMQSIMQEIEDAISAPDGKNPNTGRHFTELIDVESFARYYLVNEVFMNVSASSYSQFFYKDKDNDGKTSLLCAGPIWDFDLSMGNGNTARNESAQWVLVSPEPLASSNSASARRWYSLLYHQPEFLASVKTHFKNSILPRLDQLLQTGIDQYARDIQVAANLNNIRWGQVERIPMMHFSGSTETAIEHIKQILQQKRDYLSAIWFEDMPFHKLTVALEYEYWLNTPTTVIFYPVSGTNFGSFGKYRSSGGYYTAQWFDADTGETYDFSKPVTEDITIIANWNRELSAQRYWDIARKYLPLIYVLSFFVILFAFIVFEFRQLFQDSGGKRNDR